MGRLAQTPDGYLWAGTAEGLVRFDGRRFVVFDRSNTPAFPMNEVKLWNHGPPGTLWLGFPVEGLVRYRDGVFTAIDTSALRTEASDHYSTNWVFDIDGSVYCIAAGALWKVERDRLVRHSLPLGGAKVMALGARGLDGTAWIATSDSGLVALGPRGEVRVRVPGSALPGITVRIGRIYPDKDGSVWISHEEGRPINFKLDAGGGLTFKKESGLGPREGAVLRDRDGNLWADGVPILNLARLEPDGRRSSIGNRLLGQYPTDVFEDRDGALWLSTWDGGLNQLLDGPFTTFSLAEGVADETVRSVLIARDGTLWIGGDGGVQRRRPDGGFDTWTAHHGLPHPKVYSLAELPDGDILVGTWKGLARVSGGRVLRGPELISGPDLIHSLVVEPDGAISVGASTGVVRIEPDGSQRVVLRAMNPFTQLLEPDGTLWVGTRPGLWRRDRSGRFTQFKLGDARELFVFSIHRDRRGDLWVGAMDGGVFRIRNNRVIAHLTRRNGLIDDSANAFFEEPGGGAIWMTSGRGVCRLDLTQVDALTRGDRSRVTPRCFGRESGLFSAVFSGGEAPTVAVQRDGTPWFATTGGVARLDLAKIRPLPRPPMPLVESLRIDGRAIALAEAHSLKPGRHRVEIEFTVPELRYADRLQFRYRISGLDSEWVEIRDRRSIEIAALGHGQYGIDLTASYDGETWSPVRRIGLKVRPFVWQRAWFWVAVGLLVAAVVALAVRMRLRAIVARERLTQRELESLVEVGRELTGVFDANAVADTALAAVERRCGPVWRALIARRPGDRPRPWEAGTDVPLLDASEVDADSMGRLEEAGAVLVVPLTSGDARLGALGVGPRSDVRPYDDRDRAHLAGLAAQVAVALEGSWQAADAMRWRDTSEARREWGELDLVARLVFAAVAQEGPAVPVNENRLRDLLEEILPTRGSGSRPGSSGSPVERAVARLVELGALQRMADRNIEVTRLSWLLLPEVRRPLAEIARDAAGRVGPYRLLERLGAGGMGEVYRGVDVATGAPAAVKLLYPHDMENESARRRFEREAEIVADLDHPNLVRLLGRGEHEGRLYLAMELLTGETLASVVTREPLPLGEVEVMARQLLSALAALHDRGVLHRDLKPSNVMRERDGRFVLLDLGLARGPGASTLTRGDTVVGTLPYLAPEVLANRGHQPASDLWSLGVVLHEALHGELPWRANETVAIALEILHLQGPPASALENRTNGVLGELIVTLLSPDPAARGEAGERLRELERGRLSPRIANWSSP